jgi:dTDP-4-dehydrorhamnose 3,5-epimerase
VKVTPTLIPEVRLIEPDIWPDERGRFFESFSEKRYADRGIVGPFVQDNVSVSRRGVLRGLHFQHPHGQGKLVGVLSGEVFDVAVDIRRGSPDFGRWVGVSLSSENGHQLYVPPGFAHGFLVLSESAVFSYKCTDYYDRSAEGTVRWDDPALGITWPLRDVIMASRDRSAPLLESIPDSDLPPFDGAHAR